ncbi:hypothetical protein Osc1_18530 [Hominimerdicola sp. 21CYCFAH17_S]
MFCDNLKKARKNCNMSQEEVAELLNTSRSNISKYEIGTLEPSINTLKKMCEIYKISADELLENNIEEIHIAARSYNQDVPEKTIKADISSLKKAKDSTDEY